MRSSRARMHRTRLSLVGAGSRAAEATGHPPRRRRRRSIADRALTRGVNPVVHAVLRSPLHDLMSEQVVLLRLTGRLTGERHSVPASFLDEGGSLTLVSRTRRQWWRNLRGGAPVSVLLRGSERQGWGEVVPASRDEVAESLARLYDRAGHPVAPARAAEMAGDRVVIRVRLDAPGAAAALLRGRALWRRWTVAVTVGEAIGFSVPAIAGAALVALDAPFWVLAPVVLASGAVEGAVLGLAQAFALRQALPAVPTRDWVRATVAGAVIGANLGELTGAGVPVPPGFVVGAPAYAAFCDGTGLRERIDARLRGIDPDDVTALAAASEEVRAMVLAEPMPPALAETVRAAYAELGPEGTSVAVRSSATAEDTESASFAGMQETFLNVKGADAVIEAIRRCWASLFGARTISYRATRGMPQAGMDIAVVVQRQIRSTRSGVMFTIDPASGDRDRLVIEGALGLGESVVAGEVSPDRYVVDKATLETVLFAVGRKEVVVEPVEGGGVTRRPSSAEEAVRAVMSPDQVRELARLGRGIEEHYGTAQDTEWAIDEDGAVWMLQSRPVTAVGGAEAGGPLVRGLGAAPGMGSGSVRVVADLESARGLQAGEILVTHMTAPDWVPLMRRAAAIVTDAGGMTCHAAIVSRELGIPCVVGTRDATTKLRDGELVTVDATRGVVRAGAPAPAAQPAPVAAATAVAEPPVTATRVLVNLSEPSQVERDAALPVDGVGLLRAEMMVLEALEGRHPRALLQEGHGSEFTERMAEGLTTFATAFSPRPVTYRAIDFRTNEFRGLQGGEAFEPQEANPMIGYRGALRYVREPDLFCLELDALGRVYDQGLSNVHLMLPFVRMPAELAACKRLVAEAGLLDRPGFELWIMAEVPSVLFHLERYARIGIAGISIGSNDLTQLMLGLDRDSEVLADSFDERDEAVADYLRALIPRARGLGLRTSICGQAPSVYPEYAELLVRAGIDAISVVPDAVARTRRLVAAAERAVLLDKARA